MPLKNSENPRGLITEFEWFEIVGAIFTYLFFNGDESAGLKLKTGTVDAYKKSSELLKIHIMKVKVAGAIDKALDDLKNPKGFLHLYGDNMIRRMIKDGNDVDAIVAQSLLTATGCVNLSTQVESHDFRLIEFGQMMDLYLSDEYAKDWNDIVTLAHKDDEASRKLLTRYVLEAIRISSAAAGVSRKVAKDIVVSDGAEQVDLKAGDMLFVDLVICRLPQS